MSSKSMFPFHPKHLAALLLITVIGMEIRSGYFKGFWTHLKSVRWTAHWKRLGWLALAVSPVFFFDPLILDAIRSSQAWLSPIRDFGGFLGRSGNCWTGLSIFYLILAATPWRNFRHAVFGSFLSSVFAAIPVTVLKFSILRARPNAELGSLSFFNPAGLMEDERNFHSFPSGDVGVVAGAAGFFFFLLPKPYRWVTLLFPLCTAVARTSVNKHWPSDTLFAIGLGWIAASLIWDYHQHKKPA